MHVLLIGGPYDGRVADVRPNTAKIEYSVTPDIYEYSRVTIRGRVMPMFSYADLPKSEINARALSWLAEYFHEKHLSFEDRPISIGVNSPDLDCSCH